MKCYELLLHPHNKTPSLIVKDLKRELNIGYMVFLKLQQYKHSSMNKGNVQLQPKFYGPLEVVDRIEKMVYKLKLPQKAQIHDVFHVSQLKAFHSSRAVN